MLAPDAGAGPGLVQLVVGVAVPHGRELDVGERPCAFRVAEVRAVYLYPFHRGVPGGIRAVAEPVPVPVPSVQEKAVIIHVLLKAEHGRLDLPAFQLLHGAVVQLLVDAQAHHGEPGPADGDDVCVAAVDGPDLLLLKIAFYGVA